MTRKIYALFVERNDEKLIRVLDLISTLRMNITCGIIFTTFITLDYLTKQITIA